MAYGASQYRSGRGYSGGRASGQGFWVGRPEFTGAASNYDRWTIRPLTVPRGDPQATIRAGAALARAGKEYYNYWNRGGAEGVRQRMERGGEDLARGRINEWDLEKPLAPPTPGTGQGTDIDWDKVDEYLGVGVNAAKKVAANPTVQAAAKGAATGALKGARFGVTGAMVGAVRGGVTGAGKAREAAVDATQPNEWEPPL